MPYTVTRQHQWPDGTSMLEVSAGGRDYNNPDALVTKYPGEFETYDDLREAVTVAIAIYDAWRKDGEPEAQVGYGATGGDTMPSDACTYEEAKGWAQERYQALPKCPRCGDLLGRQRYKHTERLDSDEEYCSPHCAA